MTAEQSWIDLKQQLKLTIQDRIDYGSSLSDEQLLELIEAEVFTRSMENFISAGRKHKLVRDIFDSFRGLDVIQSLVEDKEITEIMINSHERIFIEKHGQMIQTDLAFESGRSWRIRFRRSSAK